ncbi:hypothetical protein QSE00_07505 [Arenibacter sp. M-2]|uniref:hypothetical protein n=1 Tax=Arenibacter sp. M-2 TaxID=3053612 RepID=UPI002570714F|nr:hypothetical protein [Arenibacter sp. M-2]MDL5511650.1 hypothetical protein [Arenibacter sp. M-2]
MEKAYKNLGYFFLLLIPLTFLGFYKTYFVQFPDFEENLTTFIHLHAIIASIWILLLIVQPLLIIYRKNQLHRKIGKLSYIVFPILILSFVPQMIRIINSDAPQILFFPMADSVLLILFYSLAMYNRGTVSKHMRYILGTATVFLGPTIGRIGPQILEWSEHVTQNLQYGIIYLILIGLIFYDKRNEKNYRPYLLILSTWVIHQITFNLLF